MSLQLASSWWGSLTAAERSYYSQVADLVLSTKVIEESTMKRFEELVAKEATKDEFTRSVAFSRAVMTTMSMFDALKSLGDRLYCYHATDAEKRIAIKAVISESKKHPEGVIILEGRLDGYQAPLAVKWYKGDHFTISHEMRLYGEIYEVNKGALPWFSLNFRLWNDPVLIIRAKKILDEDDHELDVGLAILEKLKWIHTVCIHCDIKPSNIVKDEDEKGKKRYYLIDFGQSTPIEERQGDHHVRHVHTKGYYRAGYKNKSTVKTDLLELLYTLREIQIRRTGTKGGSPQTGFSGKLRAYEKVLNRSSEYPDDGIYDELMAELRD